MMHKKPPDAVLLLSAHCPFCPTVLQALSELVKSGDIGRLEAINVERYPEVAERYGARAVPWVKLGPFELDGLRSQAELKIWAARARRRDGLTEYVNELLATGGLEKTIELMRREPEFLDALLPLAADPETNLQVRVGIGAVLEELRGEPVLDRLVRPLGEIAASEDARVRSDAGHFLALTRSRDALPHLERLARDADATVREVALEGLGELRRSLPGDRGGAGRSDP